MRFYEESITQRLDIYKDCVSWPVYTITNYTYIHEMMQRLIWILYAPGTELLRDDFEYCVPCITQSGCCQVRLVRSDREDHCWSFQLDRCLVQLNSGQSNKHFDYSLDWIGFSHHTWPRWAYNVYNESRNITSTHSVVGLILLKKHNWCGGTSYSKLQQVKNLKSNTILEPD